MPDGGRSVVQTISDTAADEMSAGKLLEVACSWTTHTACGCHVVQRGLYHMGQITVIFEIIQEVKEIVKKFAHVHDLSAIFLS